VSGTPLRRASAVMGAPAVTRSAAGSLLAGCAGRACGVLMGVALSRNAGGIEARSEV